LLSVVNRKSLICVDAQPESLHGGSVGGDVPNVAFAGGILIACPGKFVERRVLRFARLC
jgi:hypothetical protein